MKHEFIDQFKTALRQQNGVKLNQLLEINRPDGPQVAQYSEPSEFDLFDIDNKFHNVIKYYLRLIKSIYINNDIKNSFLNYNQLVLDLNRFAETQNNWINITLIKCCKELIGIYSVMEKSFPEEIVADHSNEIVSSNKISSLEMLANTINKSFKLSLNDKNLQLNESKRIDIYFFLSCLIKIYFKLGNIELAKSIEKALKGTRFELPKLNKSLTDKNSAIIYLYYSSILSLDDSNFKECQSKLTTALTLMSYTSDKSCIEHQFQQIMIMYLPLALYNEKKLPKAYIWRQFPALDYVYNKNFFQFIKSGAIDKYDKFMEQTQSFLLKTNLYLLFQNLKQLAYVSFIKKIVKVHQELNNDPKSNHIIPFSAFEVGFKYITLDFDYDQIECILAGLIANGNIKGYLSHGNKCIVLSKTAAFP